MTRVITAGGGGDRADSPRSPHLRFHPIPGTPDGERCRGIVDLDEPLWHNKTAFAIAALGADEVNRLKEECRQFNDAIA